MSIHSSLSFTSVISSVSVHSSLSVVLFFFIKFDFSEQCVKCFSVLLCIKGAPTWLNSIELHVDVVDAGKTNWGFLIELQFCFFSFLTWCEWTLFEVKMSMCVRQWNLLLMRTFLNLFDFFFISYHTGKKILLIT